MNNLIWKTKCSGQLRHLVAGYLRPGGFCSINKTNRWKTLRGKKSEPRTLETIEKSGVSADALLSGTYTLINSVLVLVSGFRTPFVNNRRRILIVNRPTTTAGGRKISGHINSHFNDTASSPTTRHPKLRGAFSFLPLGLLAKSFWNLISLKVVR